MMMRQHHPYLGEYPEPLMRAKLERTGRSFRGHFSASPAQPPARVGGRLMSAYFVWLREHGFTADCSVCPGIDWRSTKGDPHGAGGPDYRRAPHEPYFLDEQDMSQPATQPVQMRCWKSP